MHNINKLTLSFQSDIIQYPTVWYYRDQQLGIMSEKRFACERKQEEEQEAK